MNGVKLEGFVELTKKLNKSISKISDTVQDALLDCGNDLQQKSVDITPVDTGALRSSAFTEADRQGKNPGVVVGFEEEYAIYVHENLEAHHTVGQAKFLEQPLQENTDKYVGYVRDKVQDLIDKS
ncbi:hypothetical protein TSYNTROOL_14340 [Tepidanaerobacter syntrophicus]|uniref:HK97 gp10 family phage protein n=1 Tax=Tepidanaerobacter syntrophicus TaxID=224999 RepID=UPI0022ED6FF4|nr:HK97 gp10 family phage protein [Tepidanaerobacter syntrophicus]GLI51348.1 hypothetical protein TSYNTROOL_14340 [Tepidanaerobacter syntrophicus]